MKWKITKSRKPDCECFLLKLKLEDGSKIGKSHLSVMSSTKVYIHAYLKKKYSKKKEQKT